MNSNSENSKNGSINQNSHNRSVVKIGDEFEGYPVESFFTCDKLKEDLDHVLVTGGMIRDRIRVMAYNIAQHYGSEKFTLLCVLEGGYYFFSEIVDALKSIAHNSSDNKPEFSVEFIRLKSYVNDSSSGDVRIFNPEVLQTLVGKDVLVIEDIIDSGLSMHSLMKKLDSVGVKSVKVAVMMVKRNPVNTFLPHFIGFEIPDAFVVGCNLDYNEQFRNLQHVCVISDLGKKKYAHVKA